MKNRLLHQLAGLTVCVLGFVACAHGVTVSIPDTSAIDGQTVEVPIIIDDATNVAGFQFTVTYDPNVLYIDPNVASNTVVLAGSLDPNWTITANTAVSGEVQLIGVDPTVTGLTQGATGSLAKIKFSVKGAVGQTDHPAFTTCKLKDSNAQDIAATSTAGTITICPDGGFISILITPAGAVALNAQWRVLGGTWQNNGTSQNFTLGGYTIEFSPIEGYVTPDNITVSITTLGEIVSRSAHYVAKGDIDDSAIIDITDVVLAMRMVIQRSITLNNETFEYDYPEWLKNRANMDNDPQIDSSDVVLIMKKALGK